MCKLPREGVCPDCARDSESDCSADGVEGAEDGEDGGCVLVVNDGHDGELGHEGHGTTADGDKDLAHY